MRWTVLIPTKSLPDAKSRLLGASADPVAHTRLVLAIRADTIAAARTAAGVARVVVVTDQPTAAPGTDTEFVQSEPGLNAALREAADHAAAHWPRDGIAVLLGDLPALRSTEFAAALALAAEQPRGYVPDRHGTGTTMLTAGPGQALRPQFGTGSAARHARSATRLAAAAGLRNDVDTADDLAAALLLGVGPATTAALADRAEVPSIDFDSA